VKERKVFGQRLAMLSAPGAYIRLALAHIYAFSSWRVYTLSSWRIYTLLALGAYIRLALGAYIRF